MLHPYQFPDYKPYKTLNAEAPKDDGIHDYSMSYDELKNRILVLKDYFTDALYDARKSANSKSLINVGRDELLEKSLSDVWDSGTELPLLIYEVAAGSADAKHQYLADIALEASRGISGDYSLDAIDMYKSCLKECDNLEEFIYSNSPSPNLMVPIENVINALELTIALAINVNNYRRIAESYFSSSAKSDPIERAVGIQKESHTKLSQINGTLSAKKKDMLEVVSTSDTFYKEKLVSLNTNTTGETAIASKLLNDRADLIKSSNMVILQAMSAGNSLRETWNEQTEKSGYSAREIVQSAYVDDTPQNKASAAKALASFKKIVATPLDSADGLYVRREGYTKDDAVAIIEMLNSLPDNYTYIRPGLISVRAEYDFVQTLIEEINNLPAGSTLISGGAIVLTGGSTLQEAIDNGEIGAGEGYNTAQEVIDALNGDEFTGLTVLLPGVIGLSASDEIREAIVSSINQIDGSATLLSSGSVVFSGGDTLTEKSEVWDGIVGDIEAQTGLLSYFGITDSTLIDGSKVMTGGVLVDYLLSGLTPVATHEFTECIEVDGSQIITVNESGSLRIREMRSWVSDVPEENYFSWPTQCLKDTGYIEYKIQVSPLATPDWNEAPYIRGTSTTWARVYRETYEDKNGVEKDIPLVFVLEGSYARYLKFTFGGYYNNSDFVDECLSTTFKVYGASAYIDGGVIMGNTLMLTSLAEEDYGLITNALDSIVNFDSRNDRLSSSISAPIPISIERELNTDGTQNLTFTWEF